MKTVSATKKYASPVSKRCFKQRYPNKLIRRVFRFNRSKTSFHDKLMSAEPHHRYNCPEHGEWNSRNPVRMNACTVLVVKDLDGEKIASRCGLPSELIPRKRVYKKPSATAKRKARRAAYLEGCNETNV